MMYHDLTVFYRATKSLGISSDLNVSSDVLEMRPSPDFPVRSI